jgi:hypothetical protein
MIKRQMPGQRIVVEDGKLVRTTDTREAKKSNERAHKRDRKGRTMLYL